VFGAVVAAAGLVLVLDLLSGADLSLVGVLWALGAMVAVSFYFVISAHNNRDLPGIVLAAGGLVVGGVALLAAGVLGLVPWSVATAPVRYQGLSVAWWVPVLLLGVVTAAVAYVTGIAAVRRLGSRLASFVALVEVLSALAWAWVLLGELPRPVQVAGGVLVVVGVVLVKQGERGTTGAAPQVEAQVVSARPAA
jgi:drug/metabolite transporter (DMT)-like permease